MPTGAAATSPPTVGKQNGRSLPGSSEEGSADSERQSSMLSPLITAPQTAVIAIPPGIR